MRSCIVSPDFNKDSEHIIDDITRQFESKFLSVGFKRPSCYPFQFLYRFIFSDRRVLYDKQFVSFVNDIAKSFRSAGFLARRRSRKLRIAPTEQLLLLNTKSTWFCDYLGHNSFNQLFFFVFTRKYYWESMLSGGFVQRTMIQMEVYSQYYSALKEIMIHQNSCCDLEKHRVLNFYIEELFSAVELVIKTSRLVDTSLLKN